MMKIMEKCSQEQREIIYEGSDFPQPLVLNAVKWQIIKTNS